MLPSTNNHADLATTLQNLKVSHRIDIGELKFFGGYADVYDGTLHLDGTDETRRVAVKRFRVHIDEDEQFEKSFARELRIWTKLEHENIVPLLAVTVMDRIPCLASKWMDNGTVVSYLKKHPDTGRRRLVSGIANGPNYIHSRGVVHSDLKGDNILVSSDGTPMISDFGISRLLENSVTVAGTTSLRGNARWMAIELIDSRAATGSPHPLHTKATDVWAFGMVIYEILSGKIPFYHIPSDAAVVFALANGRFPAFPTYEQYSGPDLPRLWMTCLDCWAWSPLMRPTMSAISGQLSVEEDLYTGTVWAPPGDTPSEAAPYSPHGYDCASASMYCYNYADSDSKDVYPGYSGHRGAFPR